jgi:hypothetical protein
LQAVQFIAFSAISIQSLAVKDAKSSSCLRNRPICAKRAKRLIQTIAAIFDLAFNALLRELLNEIANWAKINANVIE